MANVSFPDTVLEMGGVQANAETHGLEVVPIEIRRAEDISPAFQAAEGRADALYVCGDPLVFNNHIRINTLALSARLPSMHGLRENVEAGGLMSYGTNFPDCFGVLPSMSTRFYAGRCRPTSRSSSLPNSIWS
jgi:putative ABC transport system substrate-binding protein